MKYQAPKGVSEYFPPRSNAFERVREALLSPIRGSGYHLVELPIFEETELFARGVGASTDVVSKEMYIFEDRGGRSLTLRPEGTVGALRCIIDLAFRIRQGTVKPAREERRRSLGSASQATTGRQGDDRGGEQRV